MADSVGLKSQSVIAVQRIDHPPRLGLVCPCTLARPDDRGMRAGKRCRCDCECVFGQSHILLSRAGFDNRTMTGPRLSRKSGRGKVFR